MFNSITVNYSDTIYQLDGIRHFIIRSQWGIYNLMFVQVT